MWTMPHSQLSEACVIVYSFRSLTRLAWPSFFHKVPQDVLFGFLCCFDLRLELSVFDRPQNPGKLRPGLEPHRQKVVPAQEPFWPYLFGRRFVQKPLHKFVRIQISVTRQAVQPV